MSNYLSLWDKENKEAQAKTLQTPTGACHNCGHLRMEGVGYYACRAPLPRAVWVKEWREVTPGKSTISDCTVWKPKGE